MWQSVLMHLIEGNEVFFARFRDANNNEVAVDPSKPVQPHDPSPVI